MKTSTAVLIVLGVLVLAGIVWYVYGREGGELALQATPSPTPALTPSPGATPNLGVDVGASGEVNVTANKVVSYSAGKVSPTTLRISEGTTVTFANDDTIAHRPASGVHPIHQLCPGLDAGGAGISPGRDYSFTFNFNPPRECPFHDHLDPFNASLKGTIIIE